MNDKDLPELNIPRFEKQKKERKGFLPWLFGGAGPAATVGGGGNAVGGAGIAALFAGKLGAIAATLAISAAALGAGYMLSRYSAKVSPALEKPKAMASAPAANQPYVPLSEREQQQAASSLELAANSGGGQVSDFGDVPATAQEAPKAEAASEPPAEEAQPDQNGMAQEMMGKLMGSQMGGLTSNLGGSGKSGVGDFGNKFGNTFGTKGVGSGGIMSSFQKPVFKTNKLTAMARGRSVKARSVKAGKVSVGKGAKNQAKAIRTSLAKNTGVTSADGMRHTEDQAWEGQTATGDSQTGTGLSEGDGGGLVTTPSLDNTDTAASGTSDGDTESVPDSGSSTDATPWATWTTMAGIALLLANLIISIIAILAMMGKTLLSNPYTAAEGELILNFAGQIAAWVAGILAAFVVVVGVMMIASWGQAVGGAIYTVAGGITVASAYMALAGPVSSTTLLVMAAVSSMIAMLGSLLSSSSSAGS